MPNDFGPRIWYSKFTLLSTVNCQSAVWPSVQGSAGCDVQYDVLNHQEVRQLSHGKGLCHFCLRTMVRSVCFKQERTVSIKVPMDKQWIPNLAFLVDIIELLPIWIFSSRGPDNQPSVWSHQSPQAETTTVQQTYFSRWHDHKKIQGEV